MVIKVVQKYERYPDPLHKVLMVTTSNPNEWPDDVLRSARLPRLGERVVIGGKPAQCTCMRLKPYCGSEYLWELAVDYELELQLKDE